jgi:hypothetical protein
VNLYGDDHGFVAESSLTDNIDYVEQAGGYTSRGFAQLGERTAFIGYLDILATFLESRKCGLAPCAWLCPRSVMFASNLD